MTYDDKQYGQERKIKTILAHPIDTLVRLPRRQSNTNIQNKRLKSVEHHINRPVKEIRFDLFFKETGIIYIVKECRY